MVYAVRYIPPSPTRKFTILLALCLLCSSFWCISYALAQSPDATVLPSDLDKVNQHLTELGYELWPSPTQTSELGLEIPAGFAQPYPYQNLMRNYKRGHRGIDIGAVGKINGGVGTPVNAIHKSKVILIGRSLTDSKNFGRPDKRKGSVKRSGSTYPRQISPPGYGKVYPFTRSYGKWRSGVVLVTQIIGGPLDGYIMRYIHLAEVRPDLKIGSILLAGEHLGVMGGTAVQDSGPHVHIDLETPDKKRVDPAPYIGLPPSEYYLRVSRTSKTEAQSSDKNKSSKSSTKKSKTKTTGSKSKATKKDKKAKDSVAVTKRESYKNKESSTDEALMRELKRE